MRVVHVHVGNVLREALVVVSRRLIENQEQQVEPRQERRR
jgi:hypothetical protein